MIIFTVSITDEAEFLREIIVKFQCVAKGRYVAWLEYPVNIFAGI